MYTYIYSTKTLWGNVLVPAGYWWWLLACKKYHPPEKKPGISISLGTAIDDTNSVFPQDSS